MDLSISAADNVVGVAGKMSATFLAGAGVVSVVLIGLGNGGPDIAGGSFFSSSSNLTKSSPLSMSIKLELLMGCCIDLGTVSDLTCTAFSLSALLGVVVAAVLVVSVKMGGAVGLLDELSELALPGDGGGGGVDSCSLSSFLSGSASSSSSILSATPLAALAKRTFCNSDLSFGPSIADEKLFR